MATTTTTSGDTATSFSNTPQAQDDIFTTGVIGTSSATITEDLLGVVYLDVMSNDLGGNAKTLWSLDNATSLSTATKVYAPADLLIQDTSRVEATSSDTSFNGAKIWITSDGKVGYDAATLSTAFKAQLQALAAGASLTDSFTYAIRLGNGTLSWATAQVQFAGANDSVTMSLGAQAGTVTEDASTTPSPADSHSATGTIAFSDVDLSDTHTASFVAAQGNATALGNFVLASVAEAADTANGTVNWTYTLDNAAAQSLAQGQTASETYVVTISDGHGSSTTQNVTITITGTNDQVQITSGVQTGDAKEDSGDYAASGSITFTDADLIDTHNVTVTPGASGYLGSFTTDPLNDSTGTGSGSLGWHFAVDNAALQFLGEGQTVTQTYDVAIGDGSVQTVTITITGTNDRPTLTIADTTGAMSEGNAAATLSDSGALSFADLDNIDAVTVSHTANGNIAWSGGTLNAGVASALVAGFSVDQNSWDYSSSQNLDFLGAGETITFSYTVVATDDSDAANAASATQIVSITITGSNDAPVLSFATGNDAGAVQEDTTLNVSGQFSSTDIDHAATATWSIVGANTGAFGSIAVDGTGQWTYTLANGTDGVASAVQSLKAGESHNEVFSVQVSDGLGGVDTQLVTVTITGTNDAPVLNFATGNDVGAVKEDTTLSVSGQFSSADIDHAATATWSIVGANTGAFGSIAVDSSGQWTYTLANGTDGVASAVQSLKAGERHDEVFSVQVSDGLGGVDTQLVVVTVTGTNDQPTLTIADTASTMNEGDGTATLSDSGALSFADVDNTDTVTVSHTANGDIAWSGGTLNAGVASALVAGFSVDQNSWDYSSSQNLDFLGAGETITFSYTVVATDDSDAANAASATQIVSITITGSNDAPVLSFATGNDAGAVKEDTTLSVSGQFSSTDIDHAATATWSIAGANTGAYGSIAVNSTGQWTYTLANGTDGVASAVQSLKAGESHDEVFSVQVSDGLGGVDTQLVTVTVTGSNDAAVLSSASVTLSETNAPLTTGGSLTVSDIDSPESFQTQTDISGNYGQFSIGTNGAWTYVANSAHNEFAAGTTYTDTFSVSSADGTLTSVTVHILGTNDAALLSTGIANLTETNTAVDISTAGTLTISDVDSAATFVAQTNTAGIYGKFSIDTGGAWTYVADTAHNEFAASTTYTDTFAVSSADGTLTSVTVHIAGSNDLPTITSNGGGTTASISVAENTAAVTTVAATDVDLPAQTLSYSIVGGADAAKFSIVSGTGALSFISAPNFEAPADSGTNNVYDVIVRASDGTLFDDQAIAVTVTGVNDNSPVITSNGGGATASVNVAENTTAVTTVMATDADLPTQTLSYSILNTAGTDFGKFSISSSGVLTFNSAPDYENAQDVGGTDGDNAYVVDVQVADGNGGTDTQTIAVNVQNVVETPVDSVAPTVTVTGTALGSSIGSTSTVTFQFSETVSGFNLSDVSVTTTSGTPRGTFSNFTQVDGDTYTATLTRTLGGSIKVDVAANSYTDLAGNPGAAGSSANLPAGVAGEPINLALDIPLAEINGPVTVAISGVPAGWMFNAGTDNGDGTWTVQTNDPGALTVTTPSDFAGALVLDVNLYWSNSDGSTASAYVFNNVEVYAPGSPIFALSADDNLTGSSGADTFVFAQPIGNNQLYNFDVTADKIDLIGFTGVTAFADLSISNDVNGNALVSIGSGQTVTLRGVDAEDLSEANFQFDRDPLTQNTGTLTIADGAIMPFGGGLHNSGTIELGSAGNETRLEILFRGATLTGGGQVQLSDNAQNVIFGGSADTVLTNVDNRISGAGQLGAGQMILANAGLILASGLNSLVLDTGSHTITNSGVLESTGTGGMTVASTVENTGHLWANGGDLHLLADVTGNGSATIDGDASLTFASAAHTSVAFHGEGAGSLVIAQAEAAGSLVGILGLESDDLLTFGDLAFGTNTQLSYTANASGAGGLLTVDDGAHRAEVNLLGHYSAEDFQVTDGGEAGTQVSYHGESSGTLVGSMLADTLSGGDGNDIIVGRGGEDTLSGGAGADMFAYLNANEGGDHILDYNYAEGDTLDLSTLLNANFVSGTSQVADFVQLAQSGSDITVQVDPDGANNGKQFVDVAVLDHAGTPSPDLVRTWFGEADHTLTA
ncbi:VCBS domain-containing protein [Pseudomonas chlororaphis]|uniref:VCBS domain-containing protein n=1 Tax=Pseudomonas chlororaphis TaxID=587753 RepID=UPI002408029D|nr:VCBS domain-containing protein [Pseudomonas chlororaphis]